MKPYSRKASFLWLGTRRHGKGAVSTPSAVLRKAPYASGSDNKQRGTSPPELIAAAHAGSFSMTLANELGEAGYRPHQIDTTATVTMEDIAAGWTLTQIHLDVIATVPRVAQCDFVDAALRAKANCPISRSLNANISMRAQLSQRGAAAREVPQRDWSTVGSGPTRKKGPRRNGAKH
jgi:osmotically inducible protein OsmC